MKSLTLYACFLVLLIFTKDLNAWVISKEKKAVDGKMILTTGPSPQPTFSTSPTEPTASSSTTTQKLNGGDTQANKEFLFSSNDISVSNVYPNPANDYVQFDYTLNNRNIQAYIIIHDVLGGNIGEFALPAYDRQLTISTSSINPGVYFYTLRLGNENVITKKMVIRR